MGSLIKMFKPSKKSSNKENLPSVTFAPNSQKPKKPSLNDSVYAGEPQKIDLRLKSPYAVISNVKHKKGPMSCPGAPMDENSFADRSNLMRGSSRDNRIAKDDSALSRRYEFIDEQNYRNLLARQQYDMSMSRQYDSDDEDEKYKQKYRAAKAEITILKSKMDKVKSKFREEKSRLEEINDELHSQLLQNGKSYDRLHKKYNELRRNIEVEKRMKTDVLKMLQEANARIDKLEKAGIHDESLNNSSLLMPSYSISDATMERSSEGAGEALCFMEGMGVSATGLTTNQNQAAMPSVFGMTSIFSTTTSTSGSRNGQISMNPMSLEDDLNAKDEVRVFRNSEEEEEEEEEDEEMTEEDEGEEMELSSPFEVETVRDSMSSNKNSLVRAHSDSDLTNADTVSLEPSSQPLHVPEQRQKCSRTSSWLKRNSFNPDDGGSSDSSEEDRLSIIERQLKKKGGLVKYNPPRTKIHDRHYKRFGKNERSALAEFEYLQDMSTDVSGMQSSPELGQLMGQMQLKK
uniref:Uncharacterized protein n=1 Tax=Caenorhabditis japonica TaxID=281687 RepID=A0A8R1DLP0_CAEJA